MDQRFEGQPQSEIRLDGKKLLRTTVVNDWGSQLIWEVRRSGNIVAQASARSSDHFELTDTAPGDYEAVLRMFQYEGYEKDPTGNFTKSKFVDVSNKLTWTMS